MRNSFNMLLVSLICFDSWYLFGSILENFRRNFGLGTDVHTMIFPHFLYPVQSVAMSGSIFMTVAIALERYIAVHYPIGMRLFVLFSVKCHMHNDLAYKASTSTFSDQSARKKCPGLLSRKVILLQIASDN